MLVFKMPGVAVLWRAPLGVGVWHWIGVVLRVWVEWRAIRRVAVRDMVGRVSTGRIIGRRIYGVTSGTRGRRTLGEGADYGILVVDIEWSLWFSITLSVGGTFAGGAGGGSRTDPSSLLGGNVNESLQAHEGGALFWCRVNGDGRGYCWRVSRV